MDAARFDRLVIANQPLDAVRLDAVKIGQKENVGDAVGLFGRKAQPDENVMAQGLQLTVRKPAGIQNDPLFL